MRIPMLTFALVFCVTSFLSFHHLRAMPLTQSGLQSSPHSVSIGPRYTEAVPGETVRFHVGVSTIDDRFAGSVLVHVPASFLIVGQPACDGGCRQVFVEQGAEQSKLEASFTVSFQGERASISFDVRIPDSATPGSGYGLWAYLLGGVNTAGISETAVASVVIVDPSARTGAPSAGAVDGNQPDVEFSESLVSVPIDEMFRIVVSLPNGGTHSTYRLTIRLPSGVELVGFPACFGSIIDACTDKILDETTTERTNGGTDVQISGFNAGYQPIEFVLTVGLSDVEVGQRLQVQAHLDALRRWGPEPIGSDSLTIIVVDD